MTRLRGPTILVDYADKYPPVLHRRVEQHDDLVVALGWPLMPGLVRTVRVVVPGVGPQHGPQMGFIVDEHPVCALSPYGPYPAFGITVRPGRLRRRLHHPNALVDQNIIER